MNKKIDRTLRLTLFAIITVLLFSCNPLLNFGVVQKGMFYRSGQPDKDDFKYITRKLKIKTLVIFKKGVESFERKLASQYGIGLHHLNMSASTPPTNEELDHFFSVVTTRENHPVWIHCEGGSDRTGIMTALYRIEFNNWNKLEAIIEMISYFHIPFRYPKLTQYIFNYKRRYGSYRETDEEIEALKHYLEEKDLLEPTIQ